MTGQHREQLSGPFAENLAENLSSPQVKVIPEMRVIEEMNRVESEREKRIAFYQSHLDRVSRSFAFCIARLDGGLREYVGLCYLLCRILDTIEDAGWGHFVDQDRAFHEFESFLKNSDSRAERAKAVREWAGRFPGDVVEGERLLLNDAEVIFSDFDSLPADLRAVLCRLVLSMSGGMRFFMHRKAQVGRLALESATDVNRYCFFVAGVVGEMLTACRRVFYPREVAVNFTRLREAFRFGLFLQKVNLLKDQRGDEKQGRFLVPSRAQLLSGLLRDADAAFGFLVGLPEKEVGFRLFCAWSLFIGLASLPWIQQGELNGVAMKIPREETLKLMQEVEARVQDNQALVQLYERLKPTMRQLVQDPLEFRDSSVSVAADELPAKNAQENADEAELLELYLGDLPQDEVREIFRA